MLLQSFRLRMLPNCIRGVEDGGVIGRLFEIDAHNSGFDSQPFCEQLVPGGRIIGEHPDFFELLSLEQRLNWAEIAALRQFTFDH